MTRKQVLVNLLLVLALILLGFLCYRAGKSYPIILENLPFTRDGRQYPALEAANVYLDDGKAVFILDGDRTLTKGLGLSHTLKIDLLDEEDRVIASREYSFTMDDLPDGRSLNLPRAYQEGAAR